ncbi:MAG: hypothetical protein A2Z29_06060 [Chloroflexi bacterium RBG_16_56_11]|nr:MAG: hypothetical protein A2Z29_06060 [Chloroflexi bacterium RBG_16_56_11]
MSGRRKRTLDDHSRVPAAVLIPLYQKEGQYYVVFIKRTKMVKTHKGQISFPGGAREIQDRTLLDTAIRESFEEVGLQPGDIEILGELDDEITTTSNYIVTPFVAAVPWPYRFVRNLREVRQIIEIPISGLLDKDCLKADTEFLEGRPVDSFAYHYQDKIIWGATARILNKFLEICRQATGS